ncbi:cation-transporting P-type ATPase [Nocardia thraciensis]
MGPNMPREQGRSATVEGLIPGRRTRPRIDFGLCARGAGRGSLGGEIGARGRHHERCAHDVDATDRRGRRRWIGDHTEGRRAGWRWRPNPERRRSRSPVAQVTGVSGSRTAPTEFIGLSDEEAAVRMAHDGANVLPRRRPVRLWRRVLAQLRDPLIVVLLVAAALTMATADRTDMRRTAPGIVAPGRGCHTSCLRMSYSTSSFTGGSSSIAADSRYRRVTAAPTATTSGAPSTPISCAAHSGRYSASGVELIQWKRVDPPYPERRSGSPRRQLRSPRLRRAPTLRTAADGDTARCRTAWCAGEFAR